MNDFVIMCQVFPGDKFWSQKTKLFKDTEECFDKVITFLENEMGKTFSLEEKDGLEKHWKEYKSIYSMDETFPIKFMTLLTKVE